MRLLDLCSGIGGFSLAATWLGWEIAGQVELDPFCRRVLAKHWPDVPRHDDVFTMKGTDFGPVDVVTAGFPCQPYSVAGKRRGHADDRAIWPEIARLTAEAQPAYALFENVPGLISLALDEVLADLEGIGYTAWPLVVPAVAVDAPHRRDRLWIVAHADAEREPQPQRRKPYERRWIGNGREDVADTERQRVPHDGSGEAAGPAGAVQGDGQERQWVRPHAGQRDDAGGAHWLPEPGVGRVAHGIPRRVDRLRALGNAIVPQVAYEVLRALCCP